jgi:subtilisin family serine protease
MPGKITRPLVQALSTGDSQARIPIIVKYREGVVTARAFVPGARPKYYFNFFRGAAWTARAAEVAALAQAPEVDRIWLDLPVHAFLDTSVPKIGAPLAWKAGLTGRGIKIGIVDTGIDPHHPDFAGRIAAGVGLFSGGSYVDDNGHGTHVAGAAAGSGAAGNGRYRGVAPDATLYIAKALDSEGSGMMSDVMAGVEWAVSQRVQVIGLSLGSDGPADGTDALSETCDMAVKMGIVVCTAAGNAGPRAGSVGAPGCAQRVITIGASTDSDMVCDFSARGPTKDGRVKPDVLFPGENIISCRARGTSLGDVVDDHYTQLSGTSMATPHAVGAAALVLQSHPKVTPEQVKDILMQTAVDLRADRNTQGSGRADVARAARLEGSPTPAPAPEASPQPTEPPQPLANAPGCSRVVFGLFKSK